MIKNLLDADDYLPPKTTTSEQNFVSPKTSSPPPTNEIPPRQVFEIPEDAKFFAPPIAEETQTSLSEQNHTAVELEISPDQETSRESLYAEMVSEQIERDRETETAKTAETPVEKPLFQTGYTPETPDETIRKSGMAYSAAIVLLVSIVFMMLLGWFADLLLGSKPFGIVGGIILGAVIGFIQFFRITSSLFK